MNEDNILSDIVLHSSRSLFRELCKDFQNVLKRGRPFWIDLPQFYLVILAAQPPPGAMWTVT